MAQTIAPASSGDCMGGNCGADGRRLPLYPSLMTLPALTPAQRADIEVLARQQVRDGVGLLANGVDQLDGATRAGDYAGMQESVEIMREALGMLGAGIAAKRVLSEGKPPRNLALQWFKGEMSLSTPVPRERERQALSVTGFHLFTMGLLIAFAIAMLLLYFFKMRRAAALFRRLDPDPGAAPPGSTPPLVGTGPTPTDSAGGWPSSRGSTAAGDAASELPAIGGPSSRGASAARGGKPDSEPPQTANWRGLLRVGAIVIETPDVKTFRLLPPSGEGLMPFTFLPGQFLNLAFGIGGARMFRSYSISSSPTRRDHVDLTIRREPRGAVSRHIHDLLEVGNEIEAAGPVGRFTFTGTEADSIVLIAGGVGITPMMSIARYLTEQAWIGDVFLIYACRRPADFIFADELATLQRANPRLHVVVTMSRAEGTNWTGPRGRISAELLSHTVPDLAYRRIHLCGPPTMMDSAKAVLIDLGVPSDSIRTELFGTPKPNPAIAASTSIRSPKATGPVVTFATSNRSASIHADQTILELSEDLGVDIPYACRVGTCGVCKVQLTTGEVTMAVQDALDSDDRANGIILACQAKPTIDVMVQA